MYRRFLSIGIAILFVCIVLSPLNQAFFAEELNNPFSNGNILYVGGYGQGNFSKIQDAVDNAINGDTVFVYDNLSPYRENVIINKSISLQGENKNTTIINGGGRGDAIYCEADNIKISGFTIKYGFTGSNWIAGIQLRFCNSCSVFNNIITENGNGLRLYRSEGNIISNNIISSNQKRGIRLDELCDNTIISNNEIENCEYSGISIDESDNCIVDNNIVKYCQDEGISIDGCCFNTISNNKLYENGFEGLILRYSVENDIISNSFVKCGLHIWQTYSYNNTVENNLIDGKPLVYLENEENRIIDDAGQVVLLSCKNITVKDLNISNVYYGIETYNISYCTFKNNTIKNCFGAIYLGYDSPEVSDNNTITENKVIENMRGIYVRFSRYCEISENYIFNNKASAINISGIYHKISGNTIHRNIEGISIKGLRHTISGNIIDNNVQAIFARDFTFSKISGNDIKYNENGIFLDFSQLNIISKNNIYKSYYKNAFFKDSFFNLWRRNYWNKLIGPKIIPGASYHYPGHFAPPIIIPLFMVDLRPAKISYKI